MNFRGVCFFLSGLIWDAIGETVVKAREAMTFLQEMAGVTNRADKPLCWTTPAGLPVVQKYRSTKERRIKTKIGDSIIKISLSEEQDMLDKGRQKSAIAPNVVHSLDAAALMKTVCACTARHLSHFAMIHDSYGTYAADSDVLARTLRETFVSLFGGGSTNYLEQWMNEVLSSVPVGQRTELPELPKTGKLDVSDVERSPFFFA